MPYFFRYEIETRRSWLDEHKQTVVVIVDEEEAAARRRLMQMHPRATVNRVEQTPFIASFSGARRSSATVQRAATG